MATSSKHDHKNLPERRERPCHDSGHPPKSTSQAMRKRNETAFALPPPLSFFSFVGWTRLLPSAGALFSVSQAAVAAEAVTGIS
jgi:hypothetical protein